MNLAAITIIFAVVTIVGTILGGIYITYRQLK